MTNLVFARSVAAALLILGAYCFEPAALAQQETKAPAAAESAFAERPETEAAEPVLSERLDTVAAEIAAARERLAPLIQAIDVGEAESWIAASPLERLAERAAVEGLAEPERELWDRAVAHEEAGAERVRGALNRAALAVGAADRLAEALRRVDMMSARASTELAEETERPLSSIDQDIAAQNARRTQVALELEQRRQTLARLEAQLRSQSETIETLRTEREASAPAGTPAETADDPTLTEAREAEDAAFERRRDAPLVAAQLDARSLPVRVDVLKLEERVDELELAWLTARLAALQAEFDQRSTAALRGLTSDLQGLIEREPDAEQRFGAELAVLRARIDQAAETQDRIRELVLERERYAALESDLSETLEDVSSRLELSGLTDTLGTWFLDVQRRLEALGNMQSAREEIEREMERSQIRIIGLREPLSATALTASTLVDDPGLSTLRDLEQRVVQTVEQGESSLIEQLRLTHESLGPVVDRIDELEQILSEALLWWPSHAPVSIDWAMRAPTALVALLDPQAWHTTGAALREVTINRPAASILTLLAVGFLYRGGRGTGRRLREIAEKTQHRFTDSIMLTYKAMAWSLLRVLPVPVLLAATGFRLQQLPQTDPGVDIIATVLWSAAIWWLAGHLFAIFISRNGVGTVHFEWNPTLVERLRRHVKWYLPAQFVLIILLALAFVHPEDVVFDVFGRAALVASGAIAGWLTWRLLAPSAELDGAFTERRRRFFRTFLLLYSAALVLLAFAGYLLTVSKLFSHTINTLVVLCVVGLGYRLAMRALVLSETRLRLRRMREQREKAAAMESNSLTTDGGLDVPEPHLSIEDVNQQTRTLVRMAAGVSMALALFWVWAEVLPALTWLDGITLWTRTIAGVEDPSLISLQDVLLAVGLGVLFTLAARNLPGLVEIILARGTRMDAASRYTVATLLRYAITVVAVVTMFSLLGLRWSELQWMVAALTLGLGFGLQEVVANFVSGLIMLFERPVRVGDTITIGEYSGTVARIRTRATTIIDWDNREIVVPNKNFITERLINWTLSDTMTRIVLPINVSYDADVDLVIDTLTRIANAHPAVLEDPAPAALFLKLGDSALQFELRVYVAQLRERMDTTSELHRAIVGQFRELGIKIAFPQLDLHIRDVPPRRGAMLAREPDGELSIAREAGGS